MDFEEKELGEFEQELKQALERRPAPPSLKRKLMERRAAEAARQGWWKRLTSHIWGQKAPGDMGHRLFAYSRMWVQVTAGLILAALLGGGVRLGVEKHEEDKRGEEAKQQVMTALKITGKALNQVHVRLAEHDKQ